MVEGSHGREPISSTLTCFFSSAASCHAANIATESGQRFRPWTHIGGTCSKSRITVDWTSSLQCRREMTLNHDTTCRRIKNSGQQPAANYLRRHPRRPSRRDDVARATSILRRGSSEEIPSRAPARQATICGETRGSELVSGTSPALASPTPVLRPPGRIRRCPTSSVEIRMLVMLVNGDASQRRPIRETSPTLRQVQTTAIAAIKDRDCRMTVL